MLILLGRPGLEKTQKSLQKKKKKSNKDDDSDNSDDGNEMNEVDMSNQKVLNWPVGKANGTRNVRPKKHKKGFQKKQNALL